jgi:hypothetical protein
MQETGFAVDLALARSISASENMSKNKTSRNQPTGTLKASWDLENNWPKLQIKQPEN